MSKLLLPLTAIPPCVRESIDVCLKAHGLSLSPELLTELGNNVAQGLYSIDEQPETGLAAAIIERRGILP